MSTGSTQLRTYRIARRAGKSTNDSALEAKITMGEARLIDADDAKNPPPEEAYLPLGNTERDEKMGDPLDALGIGLAADHQAEKAKRGRKPKAETAPAPATEEKVEGEAAASADHAETTATTTDVAASDVSASSAPTGDGEAPAPAVEQPSAAVIAATEPEAIFDRRLERLVRIAEQAKFDGGTLFGDFRTAMLDLFKHRPKVWTAMNNDEQRQLVTTIEAACKKTLERIVLVVAEDEGQSIQATFLGNFTVKGDAIEAKIKIDAIDSDVLLDAYKLAGHRVIIATADSKRFMGAGEPPKLDPDQLGMGFGDGPATTAPTPAPQPEKPRPADDSDLAGDDDAVSAEDAGETAQPDDTAAPEPIALEDGAMYRIKATSDGAYLVDGEGDGGDDAWTNVLLNAGTWDAEDTANLLDEFGGPSEVTAEKVEG